MMPQHAFKCCGIIFGKADVEQEITYDYGIYGNDDMNIDDAPVHEKWIVRFVL